MHQLLVKCHTGVWKRAWQIIVIQWVFEFEEWLHSFYPVFDFEDWQEEDIGSTLR